MVKYISDRIGVMYRGRLVEVGPADEVYGRPVHPYTKSLISAVPRPDPVSERVRRRIPYVPGPDRGAECRLRELAPGHYVRCDEAGNF